MRNESMSGISLMVLILFSSFLIFTPVYAARSSCHICAPGERGGILPCGRNCDDPDTKGNECSPCQLCHLFVLIDNLANFILTKIVPPVAALMLVIAGIVMLTSVQDPGKIDGAKRTITAVVIGLIIVYGAWAFINLLFLTIGVKEWTGLQGGWFNFPCQ